MKSIAAIELFDDTLRFPARPAERQCVIGSARLEIDLIRHLRSAADVSAATDGDLVKPKRAHDDHGLPLVAVGGAYGGLRRDQRRLKW